MIPLPCSRRPLSGPTRHARTIAKWQASDTPTLRLSGAEDSECQTGSLCYHPDPMDEQSPDISVILPVFNEAENLRELYGEIVSVMTEMGRPFEVIFCDDGSRDGSLDILRDLASQDPRVRVISFARNYGQTAALDAGFRAARGRIVIPMDADRQNDPADIPRLIRRLEEGYDVVSGWRHQRQDAFWTKTLPSRVANRIVSWVTGVDLHDYGCTLKAYRASILKDIRLYGEMHRLIPAYVHWAGGKVTEIPVRHRPRTAGVSKYNLSKSVRLVLDLLTVRFLLGYSTKPLYFIGRYGLLSCGLGAVSMTWTVIKKLIWREPLYTDPFFLAAIFLFLAGFQFLFFGLLAEMNMRIYYETSGRPAYQVKARINFPEGADEVGTTRA